MSVYKKGRIEDVLQFWLSNNNANNMRIKQLSKWFPCQSKIANCLLILYSWSFKQQNEWHSKLAERVFRKYWFQRNQANI